MCGRQYHRVSDMPFWHQTRISRLSCRRSVLNRKVTPYSTVSECILPNVGVSVSVLASGRRGNTAVVESSRARILVDAGISCRETFKRMKSVGLDPRSISAILISHEHCDHVGGLATLARKLNGPVFLTGATHHAW